MLNNLSLSKIIGGIMLGGTQLCSVARTNLPCVAPTRSSLFTQQIQTLCVTTSSGFKLYTIFSLRKIAGGI